MIRTTTFLIVVLTLIGTASAQAESSASRPAVRAPKASSTASSGASAAPAAKSVRPRLRTLAVENRIGCPIRVRREAGAKPVLVGDGLSKGTGLVVDQRPEFVGDPIPAGRVRDVIV